MTDGDIIKPGDVYKYRCSNNQGYGEDETLLGWWARLHFTAMDDDDFPDPRSLFMRLAGLIDGSACADEQSTEVDE